MLVYQRTNFLIFIEKVLMVTGFMARITCQRAGIKARCVILDSLLQAHIKNIWFSSRWWKCLKNRKNIADVSTLLPNFTEAGLGFSVWVKWKRNIVFIMLLWPYFNGLVFWHSIPKKYQIIYYPSPKIIPQWSPCID